MARRQIEFADNEWYHCYTRSIDRGSVFQTTEDYERFLQAMYLTNSTKPIDRARLYRPAHKDLLQVQRGNNYVAIGAYALMPNHFHILLRQNVENGVSAYMQKLGTSFSMYFNVKYQHIGNVFIKPFRAKHIPSDAYLRRVAQYIHLNPAEIFEPHWKEGAVDNMDHLHNKLLEYRFSSLADYFGEQKRFERAILDPHAMSLVCDMPSLDEILEESKKYYAELPQTLN